MNAGPRRSLLILGTSNSISRTGYVRALRERLPDMDIVNKSVGQSPGVQFSYYMMDDFGAFDAVIFDSVVNDENYFPRLGQIDLARLYFEMFSTIAGQTRLLVLGFCNRRHFRETSPAFALHETAAARGGATFVSVKAFMANYGYREDDQLFNDTFHVADFVARDLGGYVGDLIETAMKGPKTRETPSFASRFRRFDHFPGLPSLHLENSLTRVRLFDFREHDAPIDLGGEHYVVGVYVDIVATWCKFTLSGPEGVAAIHMIFDEESAPQAFMLRFRPLMRLFPTRLILPRRPGWDGAPSESSADRPAIARMMGLACWDPT